MTRVFDLRRQPFGKWLALYKGETTEHGQFWVCQCACNPASTVALYEQALIEGWTRSCGCDDMRRRGRPALQGNWVGRQIGQWLLLSRCLNQGRLRYRGRCICMREKTIIANNLVRDGSTQCSSCARRQISLSRWHHERLFVKKIAGKSANGNLLYECQDANGAMHLVRGDRIRTYTGSPLHANHGKIAMNSDIIVALLGQGMGCRKIAKVLQVRFQSVYRFVKRHPELAALAASLPPEEELVSDVSFEAAKPGGHTLPGS